jgi:hypothetical protein
VVLAVVVANRPVDLRLVAAQDAFLIISQNFHPSSFEEGEKFKHFQYGPAELQIPPLRFAPVGMTKGRATLPLRSDE